MTKQVLGNQEKDAEYDVALMILSSEERKAGFVVGRSDEVAEAICRLMDKEPAFRIAVEAAVFAYNAEKGEDFVERCKQAIEEDE